MGGWSLSYIGGDVYDSRPLTNIDYLSNNLQTHNKITATCAISKRLYQLPKH